MPSKRKPTLLFVSRTWPARVATGTPMRAAMTLEALARDYDIHLLVISSTPNTGMAEPEDWLRRVCVTADWLPIDNHIHPAYAGVHVSRDPASMLATAGKTGLPYFARGATPPILRAIRRKYAGIRLDAILVSRLYMTPYVEPLLRRPPDHRMLRLLDLDDIESEARRRIAGLYRMAGNELRAHADLLECERLENYERDYLPLFDQVWVCSRRDEQLVREIYGHEGVVVVPNAVRLPRAPKPRRPEDTFTILFVGTFGYYPNEDAVLWFCREILPLIRRRAGRPVRLVLAGTWRAGQVPALVANDPDVAPLGWVPEIAPCYRGADLAVVPLRAAGGTRIKILEAFSYRRPVVSTAIGAEGLEVRHRSELLIADSPSAFADACLEVLEDRRFAARLARRAYAWVRQYHTSRSVLASIRKARLSLAAPAVSGAPKLRNVPTTAGIAGTYPDTVLDSIA